MGTLPTLRMLLHPEPGFGFEAQIPISRHIRCFFAAEAYVRGGSTVRFGIEPRRFPYLQFQMAPMTALSLRLPFLRLSEFKAVHAGPQLTLYNQGRFPRLRADAPWKALRSFVRVVAEVQHRSTLIGTFLDREQRATLSEAVGELKAKRDAREARRVGQRRRAIQEFDPPEMPSLDPRMRPDPMVRLREQLRDRYGENGVVKRARGDLNPEKRDPPVNGSGGDAGRADMLDRAGTGSAARGSVGAGGEVGEAGEAGEIDEAGKMGKTGGVGGMGGGSFVGPPRIRRGVDGRLVWSLGRLYGIHD